MRSPLKLHKNARAYTYENFSNLAYLPLDLPKIKISYTDLVSLFKEQGQPLHSYPCLWHSVTVIGDIENFQDPVQCNIAWDNRYNMSKRPIKTNPFIPSKISQALLKQIEVLPYKACTFSDILSQRTDIPPHKDGPYKNKHCTKVALKENPSNFSQQPEPAGLKIMLSHTSIKSFYVCKTVKSQKTFIKLPQATTAFAINEKTFFHGAKKHQKKPKFVLSTFGIIDEDKHQNLIERSLRKYGEKAIWF